MDSVHGGFRPFSPSYAPEFKFDPLYSDNPKKFEATIIDQRTRFEYGFSIDRAMVLEEWLYSYPLGQKRKEFERTWDEGRELHVFSIGLGEVK